MKAKKIKEKILDALGDLKEFEVVFTTEVTYAVNVKAKSKEEVEKMWENGEIDWDYNDATDEDYIENSLEIYETGKK